VYGRQITNARQYAPRSLIYAIPVSPIVDKALDLDFLIPADFRQRPVFESFFEAIDEKKALRFLVSA
jgi:hypothetical protein